MWPWEWLENYIRGATLWATTIWSSTLKTKYSSSVGLGQCAKSARHGIRKDDILIIAASLVHRMGTET